MSDNFENRKQRDRHSASLAEREANERIQQDHSYAITTDFSTGIPKVQLDVHDHIGREITSLSAIATFPFHAMAEMDVEAGNGTKRVVWYGHEKTLTNEVLGSDGQSVTVLTWTHPALQVGLTAALDEKVNIRRAGYTIRSVKPLARAKFKRVIPSIVGLYEPGGLVQGTDTHTAPVQAGLKAVKLDMTREQVSAFMHRMDGFMMVSGAPGTGKTTVALQRIRFLFDQQGLREESSSNVEYAPSLTAVFLANPNLLQHSRTLLETELQIPPDIIRLVGDFIASYLDRVWMHKQRARPIQRREDDFENRAREAFFNLWSVKDLAALWHVYERQIKKGLSTSDAADWAKADRNTAVKTLADALQAVRIRYTASPVGSEARMDEIYRKVRAPYENARKSLNEVKRRSFDASFARWLFDVYDPFAAVATYFTEHLHEGAQKIRTGTSQFRTAAEIVEQIEKDWDTRQYGRAEHSWFAWLLRFGLPEQYDPIERFREMPPALPEANHKTQPRYTQVVLDEAQDLAVQEASLLASLVHPRGSLTVSADFHQIVSPVHGMQNADALKFGVAIADQSAYMQYPFAKNMRQSWEIGLFLRDFYQKVFGEFPPFDAGDRFHDRKPTLFVGQRSHFTALIRQMMRALSTSKDIHRVALLQIDDDPVSLEALIGSLGQAGLAVSSRIATQPSVGQLLVTTVEKAKGLEFDACIVVGLDDVERASLNFAKNRAYVAVSRPARRLFLLCEQFPPLLQKIDKQLYDRRDI